MVVWDNHPLKGDVSSVSTISKAMAELINIAHARGCARVATKRRAAEWNGPSTGLNRV